MFGIFTKKAKKSIEEKILSEKLEQLNNIQYINNGGCAIAAVALYEYLTQNHNIDAKIVYLFGTYNDSYEAMQAGISASCGHAVLQIGEHYVDSNGFHERSKLRIRMGLLRDMEVEPNIVYESINKDQWNPAFDREAVPEILSILGVEHLESKIKVW